MLPTWRALASHRAVRRGLVTGPSPEAARWKNASSRLTRENTMPFDLLSTIRAEIVARLDELRPLILEYEQLLSASEALGRQGWAAPGSGASARSGLAPAASSSASARAGAAPSARGGPSAAQRPARAVGAGASRRRPGSASRRRPGRGIARARARPRGSRGGPPPARGGEPPGRAATRPAPRSSPPSSTARTRQPS